MGKDQHLLTAARSGDIRTVDKLLDHSSKRHGPLSSFRRSPSINCQDVNGYTSLHHACLNGHGSIVRLLLSHNAQLDVPDIRGSTPLFLAAWAGHHDIVKMLLMHSPHGANPNAQTIENETPLHSGAQHGHNTVVAILLSYGADPAIRNNSFQTALDLAAQFGRLQVVQTLLRVYPDLILPYKRDDGRDMSELLGYASPYATSPTKNIFTHTCLHLASRNGHKKVVETLLAAGVDVNILTHAGSALHEAALCGKKSVVVTLLKAGVFVHATDGNGRTALNILSDYPPHVTYDIVGVINEFTNQAMAQQTRLAVDELIVENGTQSLPKRLFEKNSQRQKLAKLRDSARQRKNQDQANGLSHSLSSLDMYTKLPDNYLAMKPIILQKSFNDVHTIKGDRDNREHWETYKPVYKQPQLPSFQTFSDISSASVPSRSYEYINLLKNGSGSDDNNSASTSSNSAARQQAVASYVEMSLPSPPIPMPRTHINGKSNDYANLVVIEEATNGEPAKTAVLDSNNNSSNGNGNKLRTVRHSPTPDYPPPTVTEAEHTILNYILPVTLRKESHLETSESTRTTNSFNSDHVEEFVGDIPFAGLFKGSTLNLAADTTDGRGSVPRERDFLRSPSMVRSVHRRSLSKQRYSALGEDFSASRVWAEIDTIFENIGNEVSTEYDQDTEQEQEQEEEEQLQCVPAAADDPRHSLHIRNPAELLLGKSQSSSSDSHWCHSPYTLIYGEIRYSLFYLGSTVIRQLQGTLSTRKSIQKLKIDENRKSAASVSDFSLLENCTTSTKYLKAANLQTRLNVDIAVSCVGVKFVDHEKKTAICCHDIENINCVCQDTEDLRYFAYITKEQDLHYCHVFMVDNLELAKEIILTLGQAFEVAYQLALSRQTTPIIEEC
ncbi:ankyrin repeat and sterile alpha motif domain-containing protein 1B isoform X1 [Drosophila subobscura]|uniref:ankyrin repeat and sterile alpha motif domain-containing protein 1B isoform X1 n=1 Tax=Drosophila subobscura TaxID=7241 RepID=UPI00155B1A01|nr:ankyrin repeat and sterile alpha motif domain-containing protein 1B isoform X1 [Drosophila subobscura]